MVTERRDRSAQDANAGIGQRRADFLRGSVKPSEQIRTPTQGNLRADTSGVSEAGRATAALLGLASKGIGAIGDRRGRRQEIEGAIARQQGKSLEELGPVAGATRLGWQRQDLIARGQEWFNAKLQGISEGDAELDPGSYGQQLAESFSSLDSDDPALADTILALGEQYLPQLAGAQVKANHALVKQRNMQSAVDLIVAQASASDVQPGDMAALLSPDSPLFETTSPEERQGIIVAGVTSSLKMDQTAAFQALEATGFSGLTAQQVVGLHEQHDAMQERVAVQYNREEQLEINRLIGLGAEGELSPEQTLSALEDIEQRYGKGDKWIARMSSSVLGTVRSGLAAKRREAEAEARRAAAQNEADAAAAEARQEWELMNSIPVQRTIRQLVARVDAGAVTPEVAQAELFGIATAAGASDPAEFALKWSDRLLKGEDAAVEHARSVVMEQAAEAQALAEENARLRTVLSDPIEFGLATPQERTKAVDLQLQAIGMHAAEQVSSGEMTQQEAMDWQSAATVSFLTDMGHVHKPMQAVFTRALSAQPFDDKGNFRPGAMQAINALVTMHQEDPGLAMSYASSPRAKAVLQSTITNLATFPDPEDAVRLAWTQHNQRDTAPDPLARAASAVEANPDVVRAAAADVLDYTRIGQSYWTGASRAAQGLATTVATTLGFADTGAEPFQEWLRSRQLGPRDTSAMDTSQVEAEIAMGMRRLLTDQTQLDVGEAADIVHKDVRNRTAVLGGSVLVAPEGTTVDRLMGIEGMGTGAAQEALSAFLQDHGAALFGEDWNTRQGRLRTVGGIGPAENLTRIIGAAEGYASLQDVEVSFLDAAGTTLVIRPKMPPATWGQTPVEKAGQVLADALGSLTGEGGFDEALFPPAVVSTAEIGGWYKAVKELQRRN